MAKITLTRAFILRSRLIKKIKEFQDATISDTKNTVINVTNGEKASKDSLLACFDKLRDMRHQLVELNSLIDEANAKGPRRIINAIEALKQDKNFLSYALRKVEGYEPEKFEWDSRLFNEKTQELGDTKVIKYAYVGGGIDNGVPGPGEIREYWTNLFEEKKKEIENLEDQLAEANAKTFIDVPFEV